MKKRILTAKLPLAFGCLALVGCAAISPPASQPAGSGAQNFQGADIESQLLDTAHSIDDSLKTLASTQEQHQSQAINTEPLVTAEGGMGGRAAIDWSGPVEPLLEKIASMSSYRVKYIGHPPPIPIVVSITSKESVIADILKNAGLQAGKRASLIVYPDARIIEIRYANLSA
ncbi:MAG: type IVB secretion system lipoprotein DotD [Gammaproteobacteria bacterium]